MKKATVAKGKAKGKGKGVAKPKAVVKAKNAAQGKGLSPDRVPTADWEIPYSELKIEEQIGAGGFGVVSRARWHGTEVAVKELWSEDSKDEAAALRLEVKILTALRHPNIVLFMGACTTPPHLCMVTEYVKQGNLRKLLNDDDLDIPWPQRIKIANDTARGMVYLHTKKIIHRDMKSYNLLVDNHWNTKVCDFGIARVIKKKNMSLKGTDMWMAPEVIAGAPYDEKADVYSYGLVLWELITREFVDDINDEYKKDPKLKKLIPADCPPKFVEVAHGCCEKDPKKRLSFVKVGELLSALEKEMPVVALERAMSGTGISTGSSSSNLHAKNVAIPNDNARNFWASRFESKKSVPWADFQKGCTEEYSLPVSSLMSIQKFISDPFGKVSQEKVTEFLQAFGCMGAYGLKESIEKAADLAGTSWFQGFISSEKAEKLLAGRANGTFLVRSSSSKPGCFSIAVLKDGQVRHSMIDVSNGRFTVDYKSSYDSLPEFVAAHKWLLVVPYKP